MTVDNINNWTKLEQLSYTINMQNFSVWELRSNIMQHSYFLKKHCYLNKNSAISVSMRINGASSSLATDGTSKSDEHPSPGRFSEEWPWESGNILSPRLAILANSRNRGTFHSRTCCPSSTCCCTQHQPHRRILIPQIIIRI